MAKTVPFHLKEYWEDRFEKEEHFEWLADWPILKPLVEPYLHQDEPILHIGCGNSTLGFDIADSGYPHVINVDYAPNVIERMKQLTDVNRYPKIEWHAANCLDGLARFDPTSQGFSVVIDKSLCDCLATGDTDDLAMQHQLSDHVLSVTRPNGVWLSISYSSERDHPPSDPKCTGWKSRNKTRDILLSLYPS
ncbi:hypothetical protein O0I10_001618 [Lichtheimia ornata]|uniref:Methyltransferase domain-containing protein n=1 Tax=Lichtheimia ornata TaxID=688661 RepID=A0AAD7VBK3_9FUNG|nr:uncharacterized protein O0I10_001618 [Lichtheimia ornata]KAJ8662654.1 hypothetical protein O0I10_001618 [Lichtheimia ornata]